MDTRLLALLSSVAKASMLLQNVQNGQTTRLMLIQVQQSGLVPVAYQGLEGV
ncbi:hypothetical protein Tco_0594651, partial [Tanacetum coccineum]